MTKISMAVGAVALAAAAVYAVPALTQGAPRQRLDTPAPRALPERRTRILSSFIYY